MPAEANTTENQLTKRQISTLLYLESCCVDYGGSIDSLRVNEEDLGYMKAWKERGFIDYGRIEAHHFMGQTGRRQTETYWCALSEEAWAEIHRQRRARAVRLEAKRTWQKTTEL